MKTLNKWVVLFFVLALALSMTSSALASQGQNEAEYEARLDSLNNSGVTGRVKLNLEGNQLRVRIEAWGLEAGKLHPQHIHGWVENNANSTCPPASADVSGDGLVSIVEGSSFFGPVQLNLQPFTTAPGGAISFDQTFTVDPAAIGPLQNRSVVLHGLTVNGVYVPSLPVACGQIEVD